MPSANGIDMLRREAARVLGQRVLESVEQKKCQYVLYDGVEGKITATRRDATVIIDQPTPGLRAVENVYPPVLGSIGTEASPSPTVLPLEDIRMRRSSSVIHIPVLSELSAVTAVQQSESPDVAMLQPCEVVMSHNPRRQYTYHQCSHHNIRIVWYG